MQRSIVYEACQDFDVPYAHQSPMHKKNIKPEFLLLDIVINSQNFWGGSWRIWGGGGGAIIPCLFQTSIHA